MDVKELKEILNLFDKTTIKSMELSMDNVRLKLSKNVGVNGEKSSSNIEKQFDMYSEENTLIYGDVFEDADNTYSDSLNTIINIDRGNTIVSPLVGTFYVSPSPDAEPYVKVGSTVKVGDVLCIIEAMKIMNEITSEYDGVIAEITAQNGELVEFGQSLFQIV